MHLQHLLHPLLRENLREHLSTNNPSMQRQRILGNSLLSVMPATRRRSPTNTDNRFQAFIEADEGDEHDVADIAAAFQQLTSNVKVGSKPSQKAYSAARVPKPLARQQRMQSAKTSQVVRCSRRI